jgi:hypothetical protein
MEPQIAKFTKEIVASTEDYRVVLYRQKHGSDKLIVTFDPHGHGIRDEGFGSELVRGEGWDHIFVSHRLSSQYQELSIDIFKDLVRPIIADREVITYGASVGGYCAIYFAGCIGARAIALSPRNSAHHSIRDPKFAHVNFTHLEIKDVPASAYSPVIIYDPVQDIDHGFVRNYILPTYPCAKLVSLPFAGHLVAEALLEVGLLKDLILRMIKEEKTEFIDLSSYSSSYWNAELAYEKIKQGDTGSAAALLKKSLQLKMNFLHLDKLISLTRTSGVPFSILYGVIDPYMEILERSEYFDRKWYLDNNLDLSQDGGFVQEPALHYLLFGGYEGRDPSPNFSSSFYLSQYEDVKSAGANPLLHFIRFGKGEGRRSMP